MLFLLCFTSDISSIDVHICEIYLPPVRLCTNTPLDVHVCTIGIHNCKAHIQFSECVQSLDIIVYIKEQTRNESLTSRTNRNTNRTTHPTRK